jgi:cytochrome c553
MFLKIPSEAPRHEARYRQLSRLSWTFLLLPLIATIALSGRSASAKENRREEIVEKALALKPDVLQGQELYRRRCLSCHGRQADGDAESVTPALAGQVTSYLIKQLADLAEGYRELPEMHRQIARAELSTPQAMRDLATYMSTLPPGDAQRGDGKKLELGKSVYRSTCAQCHGAGGEGNDRNKVPALRGQHYSYLLRQARQIATGHRYSVDVSVRAILESLSLDALTATADYISRLPASADREAVVDAQDPVDDAPPWHAASP